jgi:hypothetical protein
VGGEGRGGEGRGGEGRGGAGLGLKPRGNEPRARRSLGRTSGSFAVFGKAKARRGFGSRDVASWRVKGAGLASGGPRGGSGSGCVCHGSRLSAKGLEGRYGVAVGW